MQVAYNAIAGVTTGGSTNAVLHLLAVAKEAGVKLTIDEFDRISRKTPLLADRSRGELHRAGDARGPAAVVAWRLLDAAGSSRTRRRSPAARSARRRAAQTPGRRWSTRSTIRPAEGGLVICAATSPDGCGHARPETGRAPRPGRVFDREGAFAAVKAAGSPTT
jgi:dihydroxy-acid dehydratase